MDTVNPTLRIHLWLETPGGMLMGLGRAELLLRIQESGSLNQAAKAMSMSYRAAWGRLKASEERMGMKLVEIDAAEKGMHLTTQAEAIIERFEQLEKDVEALLADVNREFRLLIEK
jgi:molybdate transport system regulatory protein